MERAQVQRQSSAGGNHGLAGARGDNRVPQRLAQIYEEPEISVSPGPSLIVLLFLSIAKPSPDLCRYGNVFKTHLLGSPSIVSLDPEVNRFILMNENKGVVIGYPRQAIALVGQWPSGPHHKSVRCVVMSLVGPCAIREQLLPKLYPFMQSYLSGLGGQIVDIQERTREVNRFSLHPRSSKRRHEVLSL